jgi:hypothetical protein
MSQVTKKMKSLNRKPIYGFKSVKTYGRKYFGPLFVNQLAERWELGEWYKAKYNKVHKWESVASGRLVSRMGIYQAVIRILRTVGGSLSKVRPMLDGGNYGSKYECGFHFFTNVEAASKWQREHYTDSKARKLVLCEFTGVTSIGRQWNQEVKVARNMRIVKIINRQQITKLMEEING